LPLRLSADGNRQKRGQTRRKKNNGRTGAQSTAARIRIKKREEKGRSLALERSPAWPLGGKIKTFKRLDANKGGA